MKSKPARKAISMVAALIFVLFQIAGCSPNVGTTSPISAPTSAAASETAALEPTQALPPADLVWYQYGTPQPDQELVQSAVDKILKEKINATLKVYAFDYGSFDNKIKVLMAAGDDFDLCFTSSWLNNYNTGVSNGAFMELDELLAKYGQSITSAIPAKYWDAVKVNGKIYSILNYQIFAMVKGISVRKDLAEKYKLDTASIKKAADLEPFLAAVKAGEPDITPYLGDVVGPLNYDNLEIGFIYDYVTGTIANPLGIRVTNEKPVVINMYLQKETMDYYKLMHSWYQKGYIRKDAASLTDLLTEQRSGKYAAFSVGNMKPGNEVESAANLGYAIVDIPTTPAYINTSTVTATMTAINKNAANPERAMMLYNLLYSDKELYNTLCFGIEGTHYEKVADNVVRILNPDKSSYNPGTDWAFGNQFNAYYREGQPTDTWQKTIEMNENAIPSPLLGFNYSKEPLKNQNAQIDAILSEYVAGLCTGTLDPEVAIPEMLERMKKAGLDDVIADAQAQIDKWWAENKK